MTKEDKMRAIILDSIKSVSANKNKVYKKLTREEVSIHTHLQLLSKELLEKKEDQKEEYPFCISIIFK